MHTPRLPNAIMKYQTQEKRHPGLLHWDQSGPQGLSPWEHDDDDEKAAGIKQVLEEFIQAGDRTLGSEMHTLFHLK
jgi:hypothetical protein